MERGAREGKPPYHENPGSPRVTLSVPVHGRRTLPIGTQADILRDAGISIEDFNERA
jgi:hypothetical protein